MAAMARNPSGMMVELTASRPAHGDKVYLSRTRSTSYTSRKASRTVTRRSLDRISGEEKAKGVKLSYLHPGCVLRHTEFGL